MPKVDWSKYGYGQPEHTPGSGQGGIPPGVGQGGPATPPWRPSQAPPGSPLLQIGPAPGRRVDLPVALAQLARQALVRLGHLSAGEGPLEELLELEFLASEEQVTVAGTICSTCNFIQGPQRESCRRCGAQGLARVRADLPLTMFDLLLSSGLAHSPGKAALLLRHRAVEIDGQVVAREPVPLRHGSIIATAEGLLARMVNSDLPPAPRGEGSERSL